MTNLGRLHPPIGPLGKRLKFGPGPHNSLGQRGKVDRANRLPLRCGLRQNAQFLDGREEQCKSIGRQHRGEHVPNVSILRVLTHRLPVEQIARGQCLTPVEEHLRNDLFDRFERKRQRGVTLGLAVQQ